jgi:hypothetical protein
METDGVACVPELVENFHVCSIPSTVTLHKQIFLLFLLLRLSQSVQPLSENLFSSQVTTARLSKALSVTEQRDSRKRAEEHTQRQEGFVPTVSLLEFMWPPA